MKILVTGGGGFLGRHIVKRLLARGDQIAILGRKPQPDLIEKGISMIQADIADESAVVEACRDQDVVYHVAALAGIWGPRKNYFNANVLGTRNILKGCRKHKVPKLIYTSTPSVVFNRNHLRNADESTPYGSDWLCHYAETKAIAESEVLNANHSDFRTVALRPHLIWGPGDNHLIPRLIERARSQKLRIVGDGENRVDITHVENAADAHLLAEKALDNPGRADGKAYFIAQEKPVVLWKWINDLLEHLNLPKIEKQISFQKAYRAGAVLENVYRTFRLKSEPPMTRFLAIQLAKDHFFNIEAARRDLGYSPRISTETGVENLIKELTKTG